MKYDRLVGVDSERVMKRIAWDVRHRHRISFVYFCVITLGIAGLGPVVDINASASLIDGPSSETPVPEHSSTIPNPTSLGLTRNSTDSPGGPSPPPGRVLSYYKSPEPILSMGPTEEVPPILSETSSDYRYTTVAGVYTFPKTAPYMVRYATSDGETLVLASTFTILEQGVIPFIEPLVLKATNDNYSVQYGFRVHGESAGNVTLEYAFRVDSPPKITARLDKAMDSRLALSWISITVDSFIADTEHVTDMRSSDAREQFDASLHVSVGPDVQQQQWRRSVLLDWRDAGSGKASIRRVSLLGFSENAILVEFPENMTVVDPSLVGTSTSGTPTEYSMQRKTFEYAERIWAFWYDGGGIVYSNLQISYANGQNRVTWSQPVRAFSGSISYGFDVDQRDGKVLIGFISSGDLKLLRGTMYESSILWEPMRNTGLICENNPGGPSSVSLASDGMIWVVTIWNPISTIRGIMVWRSITPGSLDDFLSYGSCLEPPYFAICNGFCVARLIAHENGAMTLVWAVEGDANIHTEKYDPWSDSWWGETEHAMELETSENPGNILSAVAGKGGNTWIVWRRHGATCCILDAGILGPSNYFNPQGPITATTDPEPLYPTVGVDLNGDPHVFWLYTQGDDFQWNRFGYSRKISGSAWWIPWFQPWERPDNQRGSITAGTLAGRRFFAIWSEGMSSPTEVWFGAMATPQDVIGQTGQPWNRPGLSPYQFYFQNLNEFVSPGSGLLTVKQTDLTLPGRYIDLEISRVFVTPRAFSTMSGSPYMYDSYPASNLGIGWRLDFPWLTDTYVYLRNGQSYVIRWEGYKFENHDGEHFTLTAFAGPPPPPPAIWYAYTLHIEGGIRYQFDSSRKLVAIQDHQGEDNSIRLLYDASGRLDLITDTLGTELDREVDFDYNADSTLKSVKTRSTVPGESTEVQIVNYGYETVGELKVLKSVADGLGRATTFEYAVTPNPYLLTKVKYPTGGETAYTWSNPGVQIGSELVSYFVTLQDVRNSVGESLRSNAFDYTVVNGLVTHAEITTYEADVKQGSTVQNLNMETRRSETVIRDADDKQLQKQVSWFSSHGEVEQVDVYPGESTTPAQSILMGYDDWGNPIYSRDGLGRERFSSFVNTKTQGGFFAPGQLDRTQSGLLFFDDFEDRDLGTCLTDWCLETEYEGSVGLDMEIFQTAPPVLKLFRGNYPLSIADASHSFEARSGEVDIEVVIRVEEADRYHYFELTGVDGSVRVRISLNVYGQIAWWDGVYDHNVANYVAKQWYRITIHAWSNLDSYEIWVNDECFQGMTMTGTASNPIDKITFVANALTYQGAATMYIDEVQVYHDAGISIGGLQPRQVVRLRNSIGQIVAEKRVGIGGSSVVFIPNPGLWSRVSIEVLSEDGILEMTSPTRWHWGGDGFQYSLPWTQAPLERIGTGFLDSSEVILDDENPPPGTSSRDPGKPGDNFWYWEGWDIGYYDFPVSVSQAHRSKYQIYIPPWEEKIHQHYFYDAPPKGVGNGEYLVQYVYIPENRMPAEIMLEFRDTFDSWEHRAYWGQDIVDWGTRTKVSDQLPSPGRWMKLLVKAEDVGLVGKSIEGMSYVLYGGAATWDYSAVADPETGGVSVSSLPHDGYLELVDPADDSIIAGPIGYTGTYATLDLYGSPANIRAFPIEGYFKIKDTLGEYVYRSPVFTIWGGDEFVYEGATDGTTNFYDNAEVDPKSHRLLAASLEFQTGRDANPEIRQESQYRYNQFAWPDRTKVLEEDLSGMDNDVWRETVISHSPDGLVKTVIDPLSHESKYRYSPEYGEGYVSEIENALGETIGFTYDPWTGILLSELNPRGYRARSEYDAIGRSIQESAYGADTRLRLYWDMESMTEPQAGSPDYYMKDLSGYGQLGKVEGSVERIRGSEGTARKFGGIGRIRDIASNNFVQGFRAVAGWFRADSLGSNMRLFCYGDTTPDFIQGLIGDSIAGNRVLVVGGRRGQQYNVWTDFVPTIGEWFHLAVLLNGASTRIYINGVLRGIGTVPNDATNFNNQFSIGAAPHSFGAGLVGAADEIFVFAELITEADVAALYQNSLTLLSSSHTRYDDAMNIVTVYDPTSALRTLHFDMETLLGGRLEDLAGLGLHGTVSGAQVTPQGYFGGAMEFDGVDDSVIVPDNTALDAIDATTVSLWLKHHYATNPDSHKSLVWKGGDYGYYGRNYMVGLSSGLLPQLSWADGTSSVIMTAPIQLVENRWYHLGGVFDWARNDFRIYLDGTLVASSTSSVNTIQNDGPLNIGMPAGGSTYACFDGIIDEVQIFDRALPPEEIAGLLGNEKGFYDKAYFDSLGRTTRTLMRDYFSQYATEETFAYNFRDQIITQGTWRSTTTYEYDFLGRITKIFSPNGLTLRPNAVGSSSDWIKTNCAANWDCVDEPNPDDLNTYVQATDAWLVDLYSMENPSVTLPIESVTVYATASTQSSSVSAFKLRANSGESPAFHVGPNWETVTYTWTTNPDTGIAWTQQDITDLEAGIEAVEVASAPVVVTQVYVFVRDARPTITVAYDDVNHARTVEVLDGRKTQYVSDFGGRMTEVREYYDAANYYTTMYEYDEADNIEKVTNERQQTTEHEYDRLNRLKKTTYKESPLKTEEYSYDAVGNIVSRKDRWNYLTTYVYDEIYQLHFLCYGAGPCGPREKDVDYEYDPDGNLLSVWNPDAMVWYSYDAMDRVTSETTFLSTDTFPLNYEYDAAGRLTRLTLPPDSDYLRKTLIYDYDALGRTRSVALEIPTIPPTVAEIFATLFYEPDDMIRAIHLGVGVKQTYAYNPRGMPTSIVASDEITQGQFLDLEYKYDYAGNVVVGDDQGAATYEYDMLNRLKTANGLFGSQVYEYDELGNRMSLTIGTETTTYLYDNGPEGLNELQSKTDSGGTTSYTYDMNGNLQWRSDGWIYSYDHENRMTMAKLNGMIQEQYTYDGLGRRVIVRSAPQFDIVKSIHLGADVVFERSTDSTGAVSTVKYIFIEGFRIARVDCGVSVTCTTLYYLTDSLGSTRMILDENKALVFTAQYDPFGKSYRVVGSERFQFTGEEHDVPTGFLHLRARQYDPDLGRFVSADPNLGSLAEPQTQDRYVYVVNNPLKYTDPTGECIWDLCIAELAIILGVLAVAGVAVAVAAHYVPGIRPVADIFATVFGFIPLYGDVYSTAYFLTQDAFECQAVGCDWGAIGLDLLGAIPSVPNAGSGGVHALKALGAAGGFGVILKTTNRIEGGFQSFGAFKRIFGKFGKTHEWHHIVEQGWRNLKRFGAARIHSLENLVSIPRSVHIRISAYYSSIREFTGGLTFRKWLRTQSWEEQSEWGWEILERAFRGEI